MALKKINFKEDEEAIFDNAVIYNGFTANTLTHIVNGIYKGAGISGATSHSGRRTGLTNLAERGVGVRTLMALAGHSNMATTQRYIDLRPAVIKAAVELV